MGETERKGLVEALGVGDAEEMLDKISVALGLKRSFLRHCILSFYELTPAEVYAVYNDPEVQNLYGSEIKTTRFYRDLSNKNSRIETLRISPRAHEALDRAKKRYILEKKFQLEDLPQILKIGENLEEKIAGLLKELALKELAIEQSRD